jgi:hypothetical protein
MAPPIRRVGFVVAPEDGAARLSCGCATFRVFHVPPTIKFDVVCIVRGATNRSAGGTSMRLPMLSLPSIAIALLSQTQTISAQSSNDYAWCSVTATDGRSCYYTNRQQCLDANSGTSFFCVQNPAYRPPQVVPDAAPSAASDATPVASPRKRGQSQ